jgi:hypothetical protein
MTVVPRRIGLLAFAAALAYGVQETNGQSTKAHTDSTTNQELPYMVESQGNLSAPKPQAPAQVNPSLEPHRPFNVKSDVPSSQIPLEFERKSSDLPPAIDQKIPRTPKIPQVPPTPIVITHHFVPTDYPKLQLNPPSPEEGLNPILAVAVVGIGGLLGLGGSILIVKHQLAERFAARPNGDPLRSKSINETTPSENSPPLVKPDVFQLQTALRRKLITTDEVRALRNKYLLSANFSFSLLVPTLLALAYFSIGASSWLVAAMMSATGALVTALLTTYALDRRHQFRSEYRTLIIENSRYKLVPGVVAPAEGASEGVSAEEFARALAIMTQIAAAYRSSPASSGIPKPTAESTE